VLNINRIFNGQFRSEKSQERGELSWTASYLTELEDVFEQKCAQSIENGTRMPRALACRMGLGGHVQRAAPGMSFVATCEHARGGPHAIGRNLLCGEMLKTLQF
jgi:hypothetical protein